MLIEFLAFFGKVLAWKMGFPVSDSGWWFGFHHHSYRMQNRWVARNILRVLDLARYSAIKASFTHGCDFAPTLSDQKNKNQEALWSPKLRKFCFCVLTASARPLCLPWTIKTSVVAQVAQRSQSGGRTIAMVTQGLQWSPNGGTVVATAIAQWTPLFGQEGHHGGTREIEASLKLIHNVYNSTRVCFLFCFYGATNGRPLCNHSSTTAMRAHSFGLLWAICERPASSATFLRLFWTCSKLHGDHGGHGEVWTSCVPPFNDEGSLSTSFLPSTATWYIYKTHQIPNLKCFSPRLAVVFV